MSYRNSYQFPSQEVSAGAGFENNYNFIRESDLSIHASSLRTVGM